MKHLKVSPGGTLQGTVHVPGDKSISHRALILGSLAEGQTQLSGFLAGEDCLATLRILRALGVPIEQQGEDVRIEGVGLHGLKPPCMPLNCGNSGTTLRLLAGILAAQPFNTILKGDDSLNKRPMQRIMIPLREMGASIEGNEERAPLIIGHPLLKGTVLQGIQYTPPIASAQVKSCLLLAGLYAQGETIITETIPTRDHTERMLQQMGADLRVEQNQIVLKPGKALQGQSITIPGDISSAAFLMVGASIKKDTHILLKGVGVNPRRTGVITILQKMGADIVVTPTGCLEREPIADIEVRGNGRLRGIMIPPEISVDAIDEFPALFIAAACAQGETVIRGVAELRVKESDRLEQMAKGLRTLGISLEVLPDGMVIQGGVLGGGIIESGGDHRIAMAFAMAGLAAQAPIFVRECDNIATSFPGFCPLLQQLGFIIQNA